MSTPIDQYRRLAREVAADFALTAKASAGILSPEYIDGRLAALTAAAVELVEQIIGEDSTHTPNAKVHVDNPQYKYSCCERVQANNSLRATQRTALTKENQHGE